MEHSTIQHTTCDHCGDPCTDDTISSGSSVFCCTGCRTVYQLLHEHSLDSYYKYSDRPGIPQSQQAAANYHYLDDSDIVTRLLHFDDGGLCKVNLRLPQIHCSSCLWLLENISRLDAGIIKSTVNFGTKVATITYKPDATTLRAVVQLLHRIGYAPELNLESIEGSSVSNDQDKALLYKLGLAGFSFGNIMLLSFPEYLGFDHASYLFHIGYINLLLSIPVLLYSGIDYIKSAWQSAMVGKANIDLPIAIGMLTLFSRSGYEILAHVGEGYLDSFTGFVFFLLIGRWFQNYTYNSLDFDRNYKSYFPISANVKVQDEWVAKSLDHLTAGDEILIRNKEIIPADAILLQGKARVDYSFVTGESDLIAKTVGDTIYAGGCHSGASIRLQVQKSVDQSYLTQLWNEDTFKQRPPSDASKVIATVSQYFTYVIISIALLTLTYWSMTDTSKMYQAFTAVLIVACPCALALAIPFTYGNILRLLAQSGVYLRNTSTIEDLQDIDHIIFDKTGTITDSKTVTVSYHGKPLSDSQKSLIKSTCNHSSHPLSKAVVRHLATAPLMDVDKYEEVIGLGLQAASGRHAVRVGSAKFLFGTDSSSTDRGVLIEIDGKYLGHFKMEHALRDNVQGIIHGLQQQFHLSLLSGDTDKDQDRIEALFTAEANIVFNQKPKDKLQYIKALQANGHRVMMIGDGLNDAGALKQSNVGIVISDQANNFSPACDGIVKAAKFGSLLQVVAYLRNARYVIYGAFAMAFMYNGIGLYFAITGQLSPVIAAILMPLSSITIIVYGVVASWLLHRTHRT